jgi:hypothetical protein
MADPTKIKRGPVVAVAARTYSEPIPDEFLPLFEQAGVAVDDNDHHVTIYRGGSDYSFVWGPAVEGHWFARHGSDNGVRVPDRDAGLRWALGIDRAEVCVRCTTANAAEVCCSAHDKHLCHLCYRRTHFVEVCVAGCRDCAAEGLPVNLSDLKTEATR